MKVELPLHCVSQETAAVFVNCFTQMDRGYVLLMPAAEVGMLAQFAAVSVLVLGIRFISGSAAWHATLFPRAVEEKLKLLEAVCSAATRAALCVLITA